MKPFPGQDAPGRPTQKTRLLPFLTLALLALAVLPLTLFPFSSVSLTSPLPPHASSILAKCQALQLTPGPDDSFYKRKHSDRWDRALGGQKRVLVKNARIWDGERERRGDVLMVKGVIRAVGRVKMEDLEGMKDTEVLDARGRWVTPGIVDLHSHLAVEPQPALSGASDGNSFHGPVLPWLRSIDGLNTHDDAYRLSVSGGVTTSLILPGSANAIGGQAFPIKLRPTSERSPTSMLVEPPYDLLAGMNATEQDMHGSRRPRWRHIKHACGENPSRVYSQTRMDTVWNFRQAYSQARALKSAQDAYCTAALSNDWHAINNKPFPEDLKWEALVDVLRGRVKVQTHCYEAVDIDDFVRLSNEFQFPVAAFHHAHEAYLVPDVLKRAYGHAPAIAMFATFSRYKREAYRHSEFAPKVLAGEGVDVVMKSDHPGIISRYLLHEAQQAHFWGLSADGALKSVTSTPARVMGLGHRVGYVREGYDADLVLWDTHPLNIGATPVQVWIDGIAQLPARPLGRTEPDSLAPPRTPNFDKEAQRTMEYDGLPPLEPRRVFGRVMFTNVSSVFSRMENGTIGVREVRRGEVVVVEKGRIVSIDARNEDEDGSGEVEVVDLEGGSLGPALVSAGSGMGLAEIAMEGSTADGVAGDPLFSETGAVRAVDGLQFGTRNALLAYRSGVTTAITAPVPYGGVSTAFSLGARHMLEKGAVVQERAALHVWIGHAGVPSVSTQVEALRKRILTAKGEWKTVTEGETTLVVETHSADVIASLLFLKKEVEGKVRGGGKIKLTIMGASEAHLLASELADAGVGVIVAPVRPQPYEWERRRVLPGPPLTKDDLIGTLFKAGVTVGIAPQGVSGERMMSTWAVRNARFDAAWVAAASGGLISKSDALAMASSNIEKLLGVTAEPWYGDIVITQGGDLLSFKGKVVAVISPRRGLVDLL
ncbi:composite domain of metallo-dependent hydrolase [Heliocybe sulcata]|uniref:Composite domain of metallo-dependent hydrolase n=1 Tax=Heliocybe sulcata TaxID=5364 RepID=A0A5C3MS70_9AGAM|nr:composite domain of metallo-dependent hydrolase [Heliocybe sulcata]